MLLYSASLSLLPSPGAAGACPAPVPRPAYRLKLPPLSGHCCIPGSSSRAYSRLCICSMAVAMARPGSSWYRPLMLFISSSTAGRFVQAAAQGLFLPGKTKLRSKRAFCPISAVWIWPGIILSARVKAEITQKQRGLGPRASGGFLWPLLGHSEKNGRGVV